MQQANYFKTRKSGFDLLVTFYVTSLILTRITQMTRDNEIQTVRRRCKFPLTCHKQHIVPQSGTLCQIFKLHYVSCYFKPKWREHKNMRSSICP